MTEKEKEELGQKVTFALDVLLWMVIFATVFVLIPIAFLWK